MKVGCWLAGKEALDRGFVDEMTDLVDEPAPKLTDTPASAMANLCSGRLYVKFNYLLDNFEAAYCGEWESEEDFSGHIVEEGYNLVLKIAECLLNKLKLSKR